MVMVSKFSNFPDELSENDELREFELSGSDCTFPRGIQEIRTANQIMLLLKINTFKRETFYFKYFYS